MVVDTMTDMNAGAHDNSIIRIFPCPGETGSAREILNLLESA
jgi:hypothetical protein